MPGFNSLLETNFGLTDIALNKTKTVEQQRCSSNIPKEKSPISHKKGRAAAELEHSDLGLSWGNYAKSI